MTSITDRDGPLAKQFAGFLKVLDCKKKMVSRGLTVAKATCPVCGVRDAMIVRLAEQRRDPLGYHARWACKTEGCGFRGME